MSLVNTRIQNIRAKGNLDQWTVRPTQLGAFDKFKMDTDAPNSIITEELKQKAFSSLGAPAFQTPVLDYNGNIAITATRPVTLLDNNNTSQLKTLTFTTISCSFSTVRAHHHNNEIDEERDFERKFSTMIRLIGDTLDSGCISALSTNKTQVFGDELVYSNVSDVLVATDAQRERIIGDVDPLMGANDFYGPYDLIGNMGFSSLVGTIREKSVYNEQNKTIQLAGKTLRYSNRIANDAGHAATFYAVQQGATGLLFRVEIEALLGTTLPDGHEWGVTTLPGLDVPVGFYTYLAAVDGSSDYGAATAHNTRVAKRFYGWSFDVCYVAPYNQDLATYANPIMALAVGNA